MKARGTRHNLQTRAAISGRRANLPDGWPLTRDRRRDFTGDGRQPTHHSDIFLRKAGAWNVSARCTRCCPGLDFR